MIKEFNLYRDGNIRLSQHFKVKEFRCKDGSEKILIDLDLIPILESLFVNLECKSINITSGYRTPAWSVHVGGYATDQHTKGNAVDIKCKDKYGKLITAEKILMCYEDLGFIGGAGYINRYAVHIDTRAKKTFFVEPKMNVYTSWHAFFGKPVKKPFDVVVTIDENLNIRYGAGVKEKVFTTVPKYTRLRIDQTNRKGPMMQKGSWGNLLGTNLWASMSHYMVRWL